MRPIVILVLCLAFFSSRVQSSNLMQVLKSQSPAHLGGRVHTAYIKAPGGRWAQEANWELGGRGNVQRVVKLNLRLASVFINSFVLTGKMQYSGESQERDIYAYQASSDWDLNRWLVKTGFNTPDVLEQRGMPVDGEWIIGSRKNQMLSKVNLISFDNGLSMEGEIFYRFEGVLYFRTAL